VIPPEKIDDTVAAFGRTVISGTPQMVIERFEELKSLYDPQAFMPHYYYGGMPQDEAVRNLRMFAATVMPEIKSWQATGSLDDAFFKQAA